MKMKKMIFLFLMMFLLVPSVVEALAKEEMQQVEYTKLFEFEKPEDMKGFQGMILTDKYVVIAAINDDSEDNVTLLAYDKYTYKFSSLEGNAVTKYSFGHANDMAYNSLKNEIYIIDQKVIHVLDSNTLKFKEDKTINDGSYVGIAYDSDTKTFYFRNHEKAFVYDENMKQKSSFAIPTNLTRQAISVRNNRFYYSCFENGEVSKDQVVFDGILEQGANLIYVYDLKGNLESVLYIPTGLGELEAMEFDENGIPYLLFNSLDGKGVIYTPKYESSSENFIVQDENAEEDAIAYLSDKDGILSTSMIKDGLYQFSPISFDEPGTYEFTIYKENKESDLLAKTAVNDIIKVTVVADYDASKNVLALNTTYDKKGFQKSEILNEEIIETPTGAVESSNTALEPSTVENPQTGAFLPIYIVPVVLGAIIVIVLYKKKVFFRL